MPIPFSFKKVLLLVDTNEILSEAKLLTKYYQILPQT